MRLGNAIQKSVAFGCASVLECHPGLCFTGAARDVDPAYAIIRVDLDARHDEARFTVRRIVWNEELAEAEVQRLQELNADKGCRYFWQYTGVDHRSPG
jgi:hypothetical protein